MNGTVKILVTVLVLTKLFYHNICLNKVENL